MSLQILKKNLSQIPGWHTNRKIVVIESDDWGSIRMPSKKVLEKLDKVGFISANDYYNRFDALASEQDLENLFEVLNSVKDKNKNPAILTANSIIANPDFKKIQEAGFNEYHYELFTDTLKKYPEHANSFNLWGEGINHNVFHPQFHGREHVNIERWIKSLQNNEKNTKAAFDNEIYGLKQTENAGFRDGYMRALDYSNKDQFITIEKSLKDGLKIFQNYFGYTSKSFIAPSYVWDTNVEKVINKVGVKYLQGISYQYYPKPDIKELQRKFNYTGKKNKNRQTYLVRNVFFEPTILGKNNAVEIALQKIHIAFRWKKPAILSSHRINFIGFIDKGNRDKNLILFKKLLHEIVKKWPDVEFMTSDQLGDLITKK